MAPSRTISRTRLKFLKLMALRADLGGQLVLVLEPGRANQPGFLHAVGQGLFAINVFAAVHGPIGDEGVRVIQGADRPRRPCPFAQGICASPRIAWPWGILGAEARCCSLTSQRATTFSRESRVEMSFRPAPSAHQAMFNLLLGASAPKSLKRGKDKSRRADEGGGFKELASFHGACRRRIGVALFAGWHVCC
jgi:hypothetical protein